MTEEILKEKNNIIFENKLIKNKSILKKRLAEIPRSSGCYLFKDNDGTLLYIGKSKSLKNRVSSYFNNYKELSPRLSLMAVSYTHLTLPTT